MQPIVITGVGVISSVGIGKERFWTGVIEGRHGVSEIESFDTSGYRTHRGGEVKGFVPSPDTTKMGRCSQFAIHAAREALADAGLELSAIRPYRIGLSLGTTLWESQLQERLDELLVSPGVNEEFRKLVPQAVPEAVPANVARVLGIRGPLNVFGTACAAGNYAMGHAATLLRSGTVDVIFAGGSDPISRVAYTGFNSMLAIAPERCQPFDRNRKGLIPAEGCAILVMERYDSARRRGARIYAELAGFGISNDAFHMTAPHPEGHGAIRAMQRALSSAELNPEAVDYISAHGTGTAMNDKIETLAVKRIFGEAAGKIPISSIKSMLGHTMSAASALEAAACVLVMERGVLPPTINYEEPDPECDLDCVPNHAREHKVRIAMSNAYGFGGHCASIVLRRAA
jgi:3-oxoacyl-[acyl-carrier-protein] synthase II